MSTNPAAVPKYDLDPRVAESITELERRALAAVKATMSITVKDDGTERLAVNTRAALKLSIADCEKQRTDEVAPHNAYVKHVNGLFKPLTDALDKAVAYVDGQLLAWRREKQRRVEEENRKREAEAERLRLEAAAQAAAEAQNAGNFTPTETQQYAAAAAQEVVAPPPVAAPERTVRTDFAAAGIVTQLDFEVVNLAALAAAVPDALEVRRKAVLDHGRALEKTGLVAPFEVDGVRFFRRDAVAGR